MGTSFIKMFYKAAGLNIKIEIPNDLKFRSLGISIDLNFNFFASWVLSQLSHRKMSG